MDHTIKLILLVPLKKNVQLVAEELDEEKIPDNRELEGSGNGGPVKLPPRAVP